MHRFLTNNRDELIARCKAKVAERPRRAATSQQLMNGIPLFIEQLTRTLQAEEDGEAWESLRISGASSGDAASLSEIGVTATAHGKELLNLGYTVDQVVHDYGDLCQAITELAVERDAAFAIDEFRTLNRCLDNAIADAVSSYSAERDASISIIRSAESNQRLGYLVHDLRSSIGTATLALSALDQGTLPVSGATGSILKRCMAALTGLVDRAMAEVQLKHSIPMQGETFSVATMIAEARDSAALDADRRGLPFDVPEVDPALGIRGNREQLLAALGKLLNNAFKFTQPQTKVTLQVHSAASRVFIDVRDHCGGLSPGDEERMFAPFSKRRGDKAALGIGLAMAKASVEADDGVLTVRDVPGRGCVFTISLPLHTLR
ncbi:sensor histidine kinase [Caenimonas terrae]|uniref:histidine kinase n=1 Tax=Caenimonas terrae TaxID=696074 RepID=A0ABW0NDP4_9BURK